MNCLFQNLRQRLRRAIYLEIDRLPEGGIPSLPTTLWAFMWFFVRQFKGLLIGAMVLEVLVAGSSSYMFRYIGKLVENRHFGVAMMLAGLALMVMRQTLIGSLHGLYDLIYTPYVGNLIRRQLYWYTSHQSLAFFHNDFAGRVANKLIQSCPSMRDLVKATLGSVWFASVFTVSNLYFMSQVSIWLAAPLMIWLVLYGLTLWYFVPRVKRRSAAHSEVMSELTGQIVDTFTNFLPIKYFARTEYEDRRMIGLLRRHSSTFRGTTATIWWMSVTIDLLNTCLLVATGFVGWRLMHLHGHAGVAALAMALPMVLQATFQSGWMMFEISGIFENLGRVQEGLEALTRPHTIVDAADAAKLNVEPENASIAFRDVRFSYGSDHPVLDRFDLTIPAGQKVGIVGRSGAGKSTLASLLMRAYDIERGEILIGGQDIKQVTQDSLREQITVVTQESYLFHRAIAENIGYGDLEADREAVAEAARRAHAHDFILGLEDSEGRRGYDAHVGERGVKLSGGQRQRIGIARAILKDAPILLLDEATSALDSESEHAIQEALEEIMAGKTVIAIAHRLSTLSQMDRILVMEGGRIVEDGTHDALLSIDGGRYARLWHMQSGGFIDEVALQATG